jgi:hypothetical protein
MTAVPNTLSADQPWRTRGELLAARADAVPALEARLYAPGRLALQAALTFVFALTGPVVGTALAEEGSSGTSTAVGVVVGVLAAVVAVVSAVVVVRMVRVNRTLMAELVAWEAAERDGRSLPTGDVQPDHRMPFDAQDDPDFHEVYARIGAAAYTRMWRTGLLVRAIVIGLGVGLGLVLTLMAFVTDDTDRAVPVGITGGLTLLGCLVAGAGATRFAFRLTRISGQLDADTRALDVPGGPPTMSPVKRVLLFALVASPFLALLVYRLVQL